MSVAELNALAQEAWILIGSLFSSAKGGAGDTGGAGPILRSAPRRRPLSFAPFLVGLVPFPLLLLLEGIISAKAKVVAVE